MASKGVGRIRIRPANLTLSLEVFVTHTVADPDPSFGYNNSYYRVKQVHQLVEQFLKSSDADAMLLGGDFNAAPDFDAGILDKGGGVGGVVYCQSRKFLNTCIL